MPKKLTKENFIERAKSIHGDNYDYSLVDFVNVKTKVKIICPEHGIFEQTPRVFLKSKGCKVCSGNKLNFDVFIQKAKSIHGNRYDYSLVNYINNITKVKIICPEHGFFEQTPNNHFNGNGCPECMKNKKLTKENFIERAKSIHGDNYDYSLVDFVNVKTKVKIICPEHGIFEQTPDNHLQKNGCRKCGHLLSCNKQILTNMDIINKFKEVHGNKYDYSLVNYVGYEKNVKIVCKKHDIFEQSPHNHLQGKGCSKCAHIISNPEKEIIDFLKNNGVNNIIENTRKIITPHEIDIYLPDHSLAIEYCGLYWHGEKNKPQNYHLNKLKECNLKSINLVQIFEDEWNYKKDIVKNKLLNKLNKSKLKRIYARKCKINEISNSEFSSFLKKYHIQGYHPCSIKLGIFYNEELVGTMGFIRKKSGFDLNRFATKYNVIGGFSKTLKFFIKKYKPQKIFTFSDLRYSNKKNNVYLKNGFKELYITKPNFWWVKGQKRYSRIQFQKHKQKNMLTFFDDSLSSNENMKNNGYYRIFDCGNIKYEMII